MVIETELNFIYDSFYTKATVVHTKKGYIFPRCFDGFAGDWPRVLFSARDQTQ